MNMEMLGAQWRRGGMAYTNTMRSFSLLSLLFPSFARSNLLLALCISGSLLADLCVFTLYLFVVMDGKRAGKVSTRWKEAQIKGALME